MVFNILLNTRYLLLESDAYDAIKIRHVTLCNKGDWRSSLFYNKTAIREVGTLNIDSPFKKYAYGVAIYDLTGITDDNSWLDIVVELGLLARLVKVEFDTYLSHLWFVKDNCISIDFVYGQAESKKEHMPTTLIDNCDMVYTCDCEHKESIFTLSELEYAYMIWQKTYAICGNFKNEFELPEKSIQDLEDPLKSFTKPDIKYHIYNRIERALLFLDYARRAANFFQKIANYFSILECLFSTERNDITYKISQRIALYIGNDFEEREYLRKFIVMAYDIRSAYVHGSAISKKEKKDSGGFSPVNLLKTSIELDNLIRIVLTKVILNDSEMFLDDNKLVKMFNELIYQPNYY